MITNRYSIHQTAEATSSRADFVPKLKFSKWETSDASPSSSCSSMKRTGFARPFFFFPPNAYCYRQNANTETWGKISVLPPPLGTTSGTWQHSEQQENPHLLPPGKYHCLCLKRFAFSFAYKQKRHSPMNEGKKYFV